MSDTMNVRLTDQQAPAMWGKNALLSSDSAGFIVHRGQDEPLKRIQKAARKIESQGISAVQLSGEGWDVESQWHLHKVLPRQAS